MSDEPKKRSRAWIIHWAAVALLVAYPLSMGPAIRYGGIDAVKFYRPLEWMTPEQVDPLLNWYLEFWGIYTL
jgi:hypothetical protein